MQVGKFRPIYSHSGATTTGVGRTISTIGAIQPASFQVTCSGGTATVLVQTSGGTADNSGNPPEVSWKDETDGGVDMTDGEAVILSIPAHRSPFWRSKITAISGASVSSYIPNIIATSSNGFPIWIQPNNPTLTNVQDPNG